MSQTTTAPSASPRRADGVRRVIRTLFERRWTAIGFFVGFFAFLMLIGYLFPPIYKVRGRVLVKSGREKLPVLQVPMAGRMGAQLTTTLEDVNSEIAILTSRPVIADAVDRLLASHPEEVDAIEQSTMARFNAWCRSIGLKPELDRRENLILTLQDKLKVAALPLSNAIEIEFKSMSPRFAADAVNGVLDAYLERHGEMHRDAGALEFFQAEAERFHKALEEINAELTRFREENDGGDLTLERTLLLEQLTKSELMLRSLAGLSEGHEEVITDSALLESDQLAFHRQRLLDLQLEYASARLKYAEDSPELRSLRGQIDVARNAMREQIGILKSSLRGTVDDLRQQLRAVESRRAEYEELVRRQQELLSHYETYSKKAEEERINQEMDATRMLSVRVIERAALPPKPWFPNRFLLALVGILLGIPLSITAALLRGYYAGRVSSTADVESELGVPVLASVGRARRVVGRRKAQSSVRDAARLVRGALHRAGQDGGTACRVLHVAATGVAEGAEGFASMLATVCAEENAEGRTALVLLGERSGAARLNGKVPPRLDPERLDELTREGPAPGLEVVDLSSVPLRGLDDAFAHLRERYAQIVVAGPPLGGSGDGASYASLADGSLLVLGAQRVHLEVARRALGMLQQHSPAVLGAVLTHRSEPIPRLLYRWI